MRIAPEIILTAPEQAELMKLARSRLTSVRLAQRAGIVLLAADGFQNKDIADMLGVGRVQVARWRQRYSESRLAGIERDLPRGAPPVAVDVARLVAMWQELLAQHGGPMLFGEFSVADAYFAPVCMRLKTYALPVPPTIADYVARVCALPGVRAWMNGALAEKDFRDFEEPHRLKRG